MTLPVGEENEGRGGAQVGEGTDRADGGSRSVSGGAEGRPSADRRGRRTGTRRFSPQTFQFRSVKEGVRRGLARRPAARDGGAGGARPRPRPCLRETYDSRARARAAGLRVNSGRRLSREDVFRKGRRNLLLRAFTPSPRRKGREVVPTHRTHTRPHRPRQTYRLRTGSGHI